MTNPSEHPADSALPNLPRALRDKEAALFECLRGAGRIMVAFSGGVDSSYLAWAAHRALGSDCLSVTAVSPSYPASHRAMAERIVAQFGLPHPRDWKSTRYSSKSNKKSCDDLPRPAKLISIIDNTLKKCIFLWTNQEVAVAT